MILRNKGYIIKDPADNSYCSFMRLCLHIIVISYNEDVKRLQ